MARDFALVVAISKNKGIGKNGKLPWEISADMKHFKQLTLTGLCENSVIMGRNTWESIPEKFRPLVKRKNIVISSTLQSEKCVVVRTFEEALANASGNIFVIGGTQVFNQALSPEFVQYCKQIYITRIAQSIECDVFFPDPSPDIFHEEFLSGFSLVKVSKTFVEKDLVYDFALYNNRNCLELGDFTNYPEHEEYQYLGLVKEIIDKGAKRDDRTKVGTFSVFGKMSRYNLSETFPIFTTKLVFWKAVVEELLWFIRGSTNANELSAKGVHIWDANGSRDFLDKLGFNDREVGDLGPVYGFQWRHFGADYTNMNADYTNQGVDQLAEVIKLIKTDPDSRRIVMSAWNPKSQPFMALPPCHVLCQFFVENGKLNCLMYQRSGDMGLGVPFNVASYSLLTCLIAQVCELQRGEFVHVIGDTHVYTNHIEPLKIQLTRHPHPFPVLKLNPSVKNIEEFTFGDIKLENYLKHTKIQMNMAV